MDQADALRPHAEPSSSSPLPHDPAMHTSPLMHHSLDPLMDQSHDFPPQEPAIFYHDTPPLSYKSGEQPPPPAPTSEVQPSPPVLHHHSHPLILISVVENPIEGDKQEPGPLIIPAVSSSSTPTVITSTSSSSSSGGSSSIPKEPGIPVRTVKLGSVPQRKRRKTSPTLSLSSSHSPDNSTPHSPAPLSPRDYLAETPAPLEMLTYLEQNAADLGSDSSSLLSPVHIPPSTLSPVQQTTPNPLKRRLSHLSMSEQAIILTSNVGGADDYSTHPYSPASGRQTGVMADTPTPEMTSDSPDDHAANLYHSENAEEDDDMVEEDEDLDDELELEEEEEEENEDEFQIQTTGTTHERKRKRGSSQKSCDCISSLSPLVEEYQSLNKSKDPEKPRCPSTARQNEWLLEKVLCEENGQPKYCPRCVLVVFGLSNRRLVKLRRKKLAKGSDFFHMPKHLLKKTDFPDVIVPESVSFEEWWNELSPDHEVALRVPKTIHGLTGRPSNSAKGDDVMAAFLEFVDENSSPANDSGKPGVPYFFHERFSRIQTPSQAQAKNMLDEELSRSLVYEFNRLQKERGGKTISNGTASNWLKKKRPLHRVATKSQKKLLQQPSFQRSGSQKKLASNHSEESKHGASHIAAQPPPAEENGEDLKREQPRTPVPEFLEPPTEDLFGSSSRYPVSRSRTSSQDYNPGLWLDPSIPMDPSYSEDLSVVAAGQGPFLEPPHPSN